MSFSSLAQVFKDKGVGQTSHILSAASKSGSALNQTVQDAALRLKYFFQHPYLRLLVCYSVIFCNFLMFAEDPVSHSKKGTANGCKTAQASPVVSHTLFSRG